MRKSRRAFVFTLIAVVVFLSLVLSGCNLKIGFRGVAIGNTMKCSYLFYAGDYERRYILNEGESLQLLVKTKLKMGSLKVGVFSPSGKVMLEKILKGEDELMEIVEAKEGGTYTLRISSKGSSGSFEVRAGILKPQNVLLREVNRY